MKKLLSLLLIICSIGVAYADDKSTVTSLKYVTDELNTRQDKFGANDGKAMTFTNAAGGNLPRDVKGSLGTNTSDSGLPTVSAVNTGLENKQDEIGAVNTNTVVTYTGTPGTLGQKGIYQDTGTYAAQSDNLIQASTFNAALRNGLNNEFVCAGTDDGTPNGNCWLWTIHNEENVGKNLFNPATTASGYIDASGNVQSSSALEYSALIPVAVGKTYTWSGDNNSATQTNKRLHGYDSNRNWVVQLQTVVATNGTYSVTATIPSGVAFVRLSGVRTDTPDTNVQLEQGSTATEYEPYVGEETVNVYIPQNQTAQNP